MERLTTRVEDKVYYSKGEYPPATLCAEMETWEVRECMKKLAEYEDLRLSPDEIRDNANAFANDRAYFFEDKEKLEKERNYWKREALKWASKLGEQKLERGKNERN